ncbi:hypothetical protein, partial [Levilactobacillus angrenensis]
TYCHSHFQLVLVDYFAVGQCVPFIIQKMMSTDFSINTKYHRTHFLIASHSAAFIADSRRYG